MESIQLIRITCNAGPGDPSRRCRRLLPARTLLPFCSYNNGNGFTEVTFLVFASMRRNDGVWFSPFDWLQMLIPLSPFLLCVNRNGHAFELELRESINTKASIYLVRRFSKSAPLSSSWRVEWFVIPLLIILKIRVAWRLLYSFSIFLPRANQN